MTLLIASAFIDTVEDFERAVIRARQAGVDVLEARIDSFRDSPSVFQLLLQTEKRLRWLITCRSQTEGGHFAGTPAEAGLRTLEFAERTNAWVDIELAAWRVSDQIRQKALSHAAAHSSIKIILSAHFPDPVPAGLGDLVKEAVGQSPQVVAKVAYAAGHITQSFPAVDLMRRFGARVIAICMGEAGSWTRVLSRKLGAFATFAALDANVATAPGQYTVEQLQRKFGWGRINPDTRIFGVVGDPIAHSLSPKLFHHWFERHGQNAVFIPLRLGQDGGGLPEFLAECQRRPWLDLSGLSITIPHKVAALEWAEHNADPMSRAVGAANTIVLGGSAPAAYNTDCYAAIDSLASALGRERSEMAGISVDVLGAGGAARAVTYGLCELGCHVRVFARSPQRATAFRDWGATVRHWDDRCREECQAPAEPHSVGEVLINCTPIGMWPHAGLSPMPMGALRGRRLVFDIIYRPIRTRLLVDAQAEGCQTLGGLDMFVRQAATQFALWTGETPDTQAALAFLEALLRDEAMEIHSVALIGARGSGKTVVGRMLGGLLGLPHLDTDEMVVKQAGQTISDIFAAKGEAAFRLHENDAVQRAVHSAHAVISLGGGAVLDPQNVAAIRSVARVVWLRARAGDLVDRVANDASSASQRPSLLSKPPLEEMEEILRIREPLYRAAADLVIDTTSFSVEEVASRIARWVKSLS